MIFPASEPDTHRPLSFHYCFILLLLFQQVDYKFCFSDIMDFQSLTEYL